MTEKHQFETKTKVQIFRNDETLSVILQFNDGSIIGSDMEEHRWNIDQVIAINRTLTAYLQDVFDEKEK